MRESKELTNLARTGWQTLEGKLTFGALTLAGGVLLKLTGIDFGLLLSNDPVEMAKAVDKAAGAVSSMAESYKAVGQAPIEFFNTVKFGMVLLFIFCLVARYIDRRYRIKKDLQDAGLPSQQ